jgi:hypothetical protein
MEQNPGFAVLFIDMFHHDAAYDVQIGGFSTPEVAREFARRRVRDSVEELRAASQTAAELGHLWGSFGEDAIALGLQYAGSDDLDHFLAQPATPRERDWQSLLPARPGAVSAGRARPAHPAAARAGGPLAMPGPCGTCA